MVTLSASSVAGFFFSLAVAPAMFASGLAVRDEGLLPTLLLRVLRGEPDPGEFRVLGVLKSGVPFLVVAMFSI